MNSNNNVIYVVFGVLLLAGLLFFAFKGCDEKPQLKESETREMKAGTPDTIKIRIVDTLWMDKRITEVIKIREEKIVQYGSDSSRFDTTITRDDSSIRVAGTTYPAIDSIKLDVASLLKYPEITRTDTIKITRVDTLQITKIIESATDVPWYDRFLVGAVTSTAVVVGLVYALGGIK